MDREYVGNKFVGSAIIIGGWKWFIGNLGWVNIAKSPDDLAYGLVYEISLGNEDKMDKEMEGYTKQTVRIELEVNGKKTLEQGLIYLDKNNLEDGTPRDSFITVMNVAIKDAVARGVPQWWIDEYIRKFVPAEEEGKCD